MQESSLSINNACSTEDYSSTLIQRFLLNLPMALDTEAIYSITSLIIDVPSSVLALWALYRLVRFGRITDGKSTLTEGR